MVGDGRERRRIHTDKTRDRIFFEAHREEITIHKVAKKTFDELDVKRIPRVKDLNADYVRFTAEKNSPSLNIGRSGMMWRIYHHKGKHRFHEAGRKENEADRKWQQEQER